MQNLISFNCGILYERLFRWVVALLLRNNEPPFRVLNEFLIPKRMSVPPEEPFLGVELGTKNRQLFVLQ